jgi:hypothetical protein
VLVITNNDSVKGTSRKKDSNEFGKNIKKHKEYLEHIPKTHLRTTLTCINI